MPCDTIVAVESPVVAAKDCAVAYVDAGICTTEDVEVGVV